MKDDMNQYIGTKIINAMPMTRASYNAMRGWALPADENGDDDGYLVEYTDGGKPNHPDFAGYVSWSPKEQFEGAYQETIGLTFGLALAALKRGKKVARSGWNGKGMWLSMIPGDMWGIGGLAPYDTPGGDHITHASFIGMRTADCKFVPWLASQTDMLAEDWVVVA
jgi:hypothetical protein